MQLICPEWIAPVAPEPRVLAGHAVLVEGDRIAGLMPADQARALHPSAPCTELPGHLLVPGLVNLHTHAPMSLLRGVGDDLPLQAWLEQRIWPLEARLMSPEFVYDGALLACAEMALGGVTCFNDMYFFPEQVAAAASLVGMRAALGIIVIEFPSAYGSGAADYLRKGLELRDRLRDDPLFSFCLAPHAPYTVSDESFTRVARLSGETGMPVHCHLHETAAEIAESEARFGRRPLRRLADLGLLGPELIAVHAVHMDDSDLALLAAHGASVAHCPHSNLKLASGIARTARMRELGINVGIGTDGAASNNRLDLLQEGRTAALLAKGASRDATAWPAHEVLHAMTLGGARALGLADRIGSIEAGKAADLVAVDLSMLQTAPVFDPVSQLVYAAGREQVSEVWIAGQPVVHKRQFAESEVRSRVSEVVGRVRLWHNRISEILPVGPGAGVS
ncbi:TRZ/ATZ family hydrolase [Quisquiliibacterium transsilvanicum]|jgi:5-methylthioadenosine/S-adenosylhomocysteine deaminase|uniref:5-methylthioadenosine/S-adenosylhomocysteine deaminase n=1 Tax=Quisquiliibacterium transsilvanicum TaxID=1549638 RepID=A0A7W8HEW9_9BURK|nr:TRZ/ATZ family hydrolase [Quisquiliibacterium transsilvanicum]MBB5270706.1 5-methylthioadenosine/S-adenosylhomocysteine deaminase [Quisquiliibacterium transsilvanicum]